MVQNDRRIFLLLIYAVTAIYLLPVFPHANHSDQLTNWATAVSLVEHSSFDISWAAELTGNQRGTIRVEDRTYISGAPGAAVISAPIYAMTRVFAGEPHAGNLSVSWYVMRLFVGTLPLFFLAFWLHQREVDSYSLGALLFATPLLTYSLLLFSHVMVAVLLYFAFRLLYDLRMTPLRQCLGAGLLAGMAAASEYGAIIAVFVLGAGLLFTEPRDRMRRVFFFAFGTAPFIALILLYNFLVLELPFPKSISAIALPSFYDLYTVLFSPSRGLLFFAPILILSFFAVFTTRENGTLRSRVKITAIAATVFFAAANAGTADGWTAGHSRLIIVVPLLLDSFFDGDIENYPSLWRGNLFCVSFLFCILPVLTFPFAPPEFKYPHNNFWGELLLVREITAPNLLTSISGIPGWWGLVPLGILLAVPYIVWRNAKFPLAFAVGALSAAVLVGIYIFLPNLDNPDAEGARRAVSGQIFGNQTSGDR